MIGDGRTCDYWSPASCEGSPHCPPRCPRFVDRRGGSWLVRPFESADRDRVLEMYREFDSAQRAQGLPPVDDARLEAWVDRLVDDGCNVVAAGSERVVGHAAYTPTDDPEPELAVFVHQEFQGRGLGTELCRHVVAIAAAAGRDGLVLTVQPTNGTAIGIYERLGFERVERSSEGVRRRSHAIEMRLSFADAAIRDVQQPPAFRDC